MLYLHKLLFFIIKSVFKLYNSSNIDSSLQFISKSVDYGNHLLGKGATSIIPEKEVEFIKYFLNENIDIVFDIGANVGEYSDLLLNNFNIKNLFLFEPSKKSYTELTSKYKNTNNSGLLSGYKIAEYILQKIKNDKIIKKYEQDLSNAKFEIFSQNELSILGDITKSMKLTKNEKSNEIQLQIMNLENGGIPVNKFLEVYRDELNVRLDDIHLQVASASKMKDWTLSDWANAWKNPIPEIIVDDAGIEVSLSAEEIESIKAQLAMKNFKE